MAKDCYDPFLDLGWQLCQGLFPHSESERPEADSAHLCALRECRTTSGPLHTLIELAIPELVEQERLVDDICTHPAVLNHAAVMAQKSKNSESHAREHGQFLSLMREVTSLAIVVAAARPRGIDNKIMYDEPSLIQVTQSPLPLCNKSLVYIRTRPHLTASTYCFAATPQGCNLRWHTHSIDRSE